MPEPKTTDRLLESTPAIRAVARAILGADAEAEDVVQETRLAALRADAAAVRAPARWLRGVARNLARRRRRTAARRARREEAVARAPAVEPDRVRRERAELHRRLVHAVLTLPDPMRTAVLLRFFEGLPPREIAARCDAPVETVRSRLRGAVALLRKRFASEEGDDPARARLFALAAPPSGRRPGSLLAPAKRLAAAALLAVVGGAALTVSSSPTPASAPTTPAPEIAAAFSDAAPGLLASVVDAPAPPPPDPTPVAPGAPAAPAGTASAEPATAKLVGRVVDGTGEPVPDASVTIRTEGIPEDHELDETVVAGDAAGRFSARLAPGLVYRLTASREGYGPRNSPTVRVEPEGTPPVILEVRRRAPLAGRVTTETGDPIAGATVTVDRAWEEDGSHVGGHEEVATDADGRFEIDGFAAGVRVRLVAKQPGFAVHFAGPFRVPAEPRELAIALAPERPLLVRVVGAGDEGPVANAAIRGMFGGGEFRPQITGETDAAGGCRLRGWDGRSDLVLDVSRPGCYWSRLVVPAGDERTVVVRLRATGHRTVRGRVTRSGRSPGTRVSIYARCPGDPERPGATTYTDEEGRFELSGLRGGDEYVLEATSAGLSYGEYRSPPVWFRADEGPDLEVPLLRTGHLAGLAVAPAPGESRAAVHVRIDRILLPDGGEPRPAPWLREFRPGRFAMRLPPGTYTVSVLLSGHLPRTFRDVRVKAGKTVDLGRVEFDPGGTAEATARDGDGSPLAAVEIFGMHEDGWFTYLGRTDESGRRTLRALRPGRWTILGRRKDDRLAVLGETRVAGRAGTALAAVLATPGRLVVTGPSGAAFTVRADRPAPLDDLLVAGALRVWWPGTPEPPERVAKEPDFAVAAAGRTDLGGLAPGDYVVASGGRSVRVRVRPGETTEVRLPLR